MSPIRLSRIESSLRLIISFNEACNRHDVAQMLGHMSDDCRFEHSGPAPDGAVYLGKAEIARFWQARFRDAPHSHIEIEDVFGLGRRCIMYWRYDAGAGGEAVRGVDIFRVRDGVISEMLSYVQA